MIIAAITPIAFWVNRSKRLFVKREFEEELFEYISSHINFYFPSVVPPLLEICIKKMTFLKEERKGKKRITLRPFTQSQPSFDPNQI